MLLLSPLFYRYYSTWKLHTFPCSIQVSHVQLALLTEKCSGPVGLAVGVHYVCSPQGGSQHDAALAQSHFSFFKTWQFKMDRHSTESNTTGCLHLDKRGSQCMEMLGICDQGHNKHHPPNIKCPQIQIANRSGILTCMSYIMSMKKFIGRMLK
jgi:hypothetical protein